MRWEESLRFRGRGKENTENNDLEARAPISSWNTMIVKGNSNVKINKNRLLLLVISSY
jgi:hypothetical protein